MSVKLCDWEEDVSMKDSKTGLNFVVVGTGRSATAYISRIFNGLGVRCGHESVFTRHGLMKNQGYMGDSSWKASPHLGEFHGAVFHQIRHPLSVFNSMMGSPPADRRPYIDTDCSEEVAAMRIYLGWNRMCERGSPYIRYQVEELTPELLCSLCDLIGEPAQRSLAEKVLNEIPKNVNSKPRANYSWAELPDCVEKEKLFLIGQRYGYDMKKLV